MVRPRSCRVIYYFDTPVLGRRHQSFGHVRYQKINMCPNFCMLYYLENAEMTECMTCRHSRYKPRTGRGKTLVAYKKLWYFLITPRLQRLFMSRRTAEHMTWHQTHDVVDGVMVHPSDGEAWKRFNSVHTDFSAESRNVRLGLCTDGFNPFGSFAAPYFYWPVILKIGRASCRERVSPYV